MKCLHMSNKVRQTYIDGHKNKMKVRYATETLRSLVADEVEFCENGL